MIEFKGVEIEIPAGMVAEVEGNRVTVRAKPQAGGIYVGGWIGGSSFAEQISVTAPTETALREFDNNGSIAIERLGPSDYWFGECFRGRVLLGGTSAHRAERVYRAGVLASTGYHPEQH